MTQPLPMNATLRDLRSTPREQEEFVRLALKAFGTARRDCGAVNLRMGITGTGQRPNYRFEDNTGTVIVAIDGNTHRPWRGDDAPAGTNNWSTEAASYDDVARLLGELRQR